MLHHGVSVIFFFFFYLTPEIRLGFADRHVQQGKLAVHTVMIVDLDFSSHDFISGWKNNAHFMCI